MITRSVCFSYTHMKHKAHTRATAAGISQTPNQQFLRGGSATLTEEGSRIRGPEFTPGQSKMCFVAFNSLSSICKVEQSSHV